MKPSFKKDDQNTEFVKMDLQISAQFLFVNFPHVPSLHSHRSAFQKLSVSSACLRVPYSDTSSLWQLFCSALVLCSSFICSPSPHITASHTQSILETNRVAKQSSCWGNRA